MVVFLFFCVVTALCAQESRLEMVVHPYTMQDSILMELTPLADGETGNVLELDLSKITGGRNLEGDALSFPLVYGSVKDTKMLLTDLGGAADFYNWNERTMENHLSETRMSDDRAIMMGRCWGIAVYNLYSYFYGNLWTGNPLALSQDEIVFLGNVHDLDNGDSINKVFDIYKGTGSSVQTVAYLVNSVFQYDKAKAMDSSVTVEYCKRELALGKPIPIFYQKRDGGHLALIVGLAATLNGDTLIRIANTDNFGSTRYTPLKTKNGEYLIQATCIEYEIPERFLKTDATYSVYKDSDGDGICDFDEAHRFHTDWNLADTDGDGVPDFAEVHSYTIRSPISIGKGFSPPGFIDADGDGLRPEVDDDSDGDGKKDGEEDKNGNGIYEPTSGESDPYFDERVGSASELLQDVPENITLYARRVLYFNDNSTCGNSETGSLCQIASEGNISSTAVNLGARASVGNIFSKGGVWLRNSSKAQNILVYSDSSLSYKDEASILTAQAKSKYSHLLVQKENLWPYTYDAQLEDYKVSGWKRKIISAGTTDTIQDGDSFGLLKVESGATLYISAGEIFVGDIQMESGSFVRFASPGDSTILHLNGSFVWRATLDVSSDSMQLIAKGFKVIGHSSNSMHVEGEWAGTIFAPTGNLVLCQTVKTAYGRFLADYVSVHQSAKIHSVAFRPLKKSTTIAQK